MIRALVYLGTAAGAGNAPYPASLEGAKQLFAVAEQGRSSEELLCLDSLAGNLARTQPQLFRVSSPEWLSDLGDAYSKFLRDLQSGHGVSVDSSLATANLTDILSHFRGGIVGYLRCGSADASTSAALTLAAAGEGMLVAASEDVVGALEASGVQQVRDLRGSNVSQVLTEALPSLSSRVVVFQDASKMANLGDYAVFARAPVMAYGSDDAAQNRILSHTTAPATALGWGPENDFVSTLNNHGVYVHASDWSKNLAALGNVPTSRVVQPQAPMTTPIENAHTVAFLMSDGDNIQWTIGGWVTDEKWWGSSQRGSVPVGWTFSPASHWLAPSVLRSVLSNASAKDELVAGPSGVGYMFPREWPEKMQDFTELTFEGMAAANMRLVNVLGQNDDLPDLNRLAPLVDSQDVDGMLYYSWGEGYAGHHGKLWWENEKPVLSSRFSLWGEERSGPMMGVQDLIQSLKNMSKDPTSIDGYSLVTVHAWSHSYADIVDVVKGLADGGFDVVLPSELLRRIRSMHKNVSPITV